MCSCRGNKLFKSSTLLRTNVGTSDSQYQTNCKHYISIFSQNEIFNGFLMTRSSERICMYPHISFCNPHSWLLTWSSISLSFLLRLLSPKTCRLTPLSRVEPSGRRREDERATEGRVVLQWGTAASLSLRRSGTATVGRGDESGADSGEQREWRDGWGPGVHGGETRTRGAVQKIYICISMEFDPIWPKKIDTWWKVGFLFIIRLLQVFS